MTASQIERSSKDQPEEDDGAPPLMAVGVAGPHLVSVEHGPAGQPDAKCGNASASCDAARIASDRSAAVSATTVPPS